MIDVKQFGKGALQDTPDIRDFKYKELCGSVPAFDWEEGFDIEQELGKKLKVENQGSSSSCVAQAWSKYAEVLEILERKSFTDLSAKDIYQRIFSPQGGAEIRLGGKLLQAMGVNKEAEVVSYENGNPPSETFMRNFVGGNPEEAKIFSAKSYASVVPSNIDVIAQVIRDSKGCVSGFVGSNEGWGKTKVRPPKAGEQTWGHATFQGKALLIDGVKTIWFLNSWGEKVGENGWQYFTEEYLSNMFSLWTLIDNIKIMQTNVKLTKRGSEFGFYLPCDSPEGLKNEAKHYGIEIPLLEDGSVNWAELDKKIDYKIEE